MTYSRQQWDRAVGLYIRYECCAADAIHELGYPSKEALRMWYRERLEEERAGVPSRRGERQRRYSEEQKCAAVDHYLECGRRLSRTMRMLGYPESKELLMAWIDELAPGRRRLRHGPVPEELKRKAVVAVASGRLKSHEAAAELGVQAAVVREWKRQMLAGSKETHVARERRERPGGRRRRTARGSGCAGGGRRFAGCGRSGGRVGVDGEAAGADAGPSGRAGRRRRAAAAGEEGARRRDRDPPGRVGAVGKRAGRRPGKPDQPGEDDSRQANQ